MPVVETLFGETVPAAHAALAEEADVDKETQWQAVVGDGHGDGCSDEAKVKLPNQEPVEERIERTQNHQDI